MTKRAIHIEPWPASPAKDAREAIALYSDIVCALEHVAPTLALLADTSVSQWKRDNAVIETDNLSYELRRARALLRGLQPVGYLGGNEFSLDIQSALEWSGVINLKKGDPKAIKILNSALAIILPYCELHGVEVAK